MSRHPGSFRRGRLVAAAIFGWGLGGFFAGPGLRAQPASAPSAASFDTFQIIGDRNIFDANRVGSVSHAPQPHVDTLSLVGTMEYDRGTLAFFDSPDGTYRRAVHVGDMIAQFKVVHISPNRVDLTHDTQHLSLRMGQQLRRPLGGEWALGSAPGVAASVPVSAPEAAPDDSAVLRRLLEQRKQQLKQ